MTLLQLTLYSLRIPVLAHVRMALSWLNPVLIVKTNSYKYCFTNRMVNDWNSLPSQLVNADSLNTFKNKIDLNFGDIMYKIYSRADKGIKQCKKFY